MHLPNTGVPGHRELFEGLQPLATKDAIIFDERYNGGGFIPEEMAFMVGGRLLNFWSQRHNDLYSQPFVIHTGPKVVLINGQAASGGDAFPYYFRKLGLGTIIGERTWGGLVGMSGNPGFVDGSSISVPRFAFVDTDGNWAVEAEGVSPDIEVWDTPHLIARGEEPMLERAVAHLLDASDPTEENPLLPRLEAWVVNEMVNRTGNKTLAARMLGITKPTVYDRLRRYEALYGPDRASEGESGG